MHDRRCAHGAEADDLCKVNGDYFSTLAGGRDLQSRSCSEGGLFGEEVLLMQGTRLVKCFAGTSWGAGDFRRCLNADHFLWVSFADLCVNVM